MFINNFDPVAFNILSFEIRWYSLAYIFGILIGWYYCKKKILIDEILSKKFDDYITYLIVGLIIGGRLGYVIFYNPDYYIKNPSEIIKVWNGGMSFHGAVIGIILFNYFFAKINKLNFFLFLDYVSLVAPIGLFFGRIANFINSELYGKPTSFFLGVIFPKVDMIPRHPSQLYEAFLEGIILFVIMNSILFKDNYKTGTCSYIFLIFYGIFRIFSEFYREPDFQVGYLFDLISMGTMLSILMVIAGIIIFLKKDDIK